MFTITACILAVTAQEGSGDQAAHAALRKLGERMRSVRTFSAAVTQGRKTALLKEPLVSSGTLYYRKDPARLVVRVEKPRSAVIHLDRRTYQVYRPDEKRLERLHLAGKGPLAKILDLFQPQADTLQDAFDLERLPSDKGRLRLLLSPKKAAPREHIDRLEMELAEGDGGLRSVVYTDPDGDVVTLTLTSPEFDPKLPEDTFRMAVPEGTRIIDTRMDGKRP